MSCRGCGGPIPERGAGRPRLYCSAACRQRAYRGRRAVAAHPETATETLAELAQRLRENADLMVLLLRGWTPPSPIPTVDELVRESGEVLGRIGRLTELVDDRHLGRHGRP